MLEFRAAKRKVALPPVPPTVPHSAPASHAEVGPSGRAARAQNCGFAQVDALMRSLSADSETSLDTTRSSSGDSTATSSTTSEAEREARQREEDERVVDEELNKYSGEGVTQESTDFDLLKYWEVSSPALYLANASSREYGEVSRRSIPHSFPDCTRHTPGASICRSERASILRKQGDRYQSSQQHGCRAHGDAPGPQVCIPRGQVVFYSRLDRAKATHRPGLP